jgi:hypothetical protein
MITGRRVAGRWRWGRSPFFRSTPDLRPWLTCFSPPLFIASLARSRICRSAAQWPLALILSNYGILVGGIAGILIQTERL